MDYLAHRTEDGRVQPLMAHLQNTANLAGQFARPFGAADFVYAIGLCHDIGKYSDKFQRRIRGASIPVDHSTAGGQLLYELNNHLLGLLAAYCILGHHSGIPDGGSESQSASGESELYGRLKKELEKYDACFDDLGQLPGLTAPDITITDGFSLAFFCRMAYSALVDADWLDTEDFMSDGAVQRGGFQSIPELNASIQAYTRKFSKPADELNRKRGELLQDCLAAADSAKGLFTLTAPTGSGKTISSAAFALSHAEKHGMERVIYVVPYNTIIEQNAKVFEDILGKDNIVQHHCNIEYSNQDDSPDYKKLLATENWDAPFIVTSSVQFFESLFGNRSGSCRKLHNIANSVIVFDEAQMIPVPYLKPCVAVIRELVQNYSVTAVLATATQSSLEPFFAPLEAAEMVRSPEALYEAFRRVNYQILEEALPIEDLAEKLNGHRQALCVVNTRKKAQAVAELLAGDPYHLSTTMIPSHRSCVLDEIRGKLKAGEACRVVSTSLIEAGVDVDFPIVYREKAGLDSIIQAAGRCNREGKNARDDSMAFIFETDEEVPRGIAINVAAYEQVARDQEDIASLASIKQYFEQLRYIKGEEALDYKHVLRAFNEGQKTASFPFATIAKEFRLIEQNTKTVIVPRNKEGEALASRLRYGERNKALLRAIQQYSVSLYENDIRNLRELGALEELDDGAMYILTSPKVYYSEVYGITLTPAGGNAVVV